MKEKNKDIDQTANAVGAKSEGQILKEITFFISRYFLIEIDYPKEEDIRLAQRLAELTLTLMAQMLQRGVREERLPVFSVTFYVKDLGGGVGEMNYAYETSGGTMFEQLKLGLMGRELEEAIGEWCTKVWGGKLNTKAAEVIQAWGRVADCKKDK